MYQLGLMKTNSEIAESLGVSLKTVQNHRNNICNKLEIKGRHALLKYAVEKKDLLQI
jgi:DNA-binding CsgD family transcriptional regulator